MCIMDKEQSIRPPSPHPSKEAVYVFHIGQAWNWQKSSFGPSGYIDRELVIGWSVCKKVATVASSSCMFIAWVCSPIDSAY